MAEITAAAVKALRESSGAGMMDCKKALTENDGDMEAAQDWLRTKGLAAAAKKAGRIAAEGLVGVVAGDGVAAIAEVNSETDFVARNDAFQEFVAAVTGLALAAEGDQEAALATALSLRTLKSLEYPFQIVRPSEMLSPALRDFASSTNERCSLFTPAAADVPVLLAAVVAALNATSTARLAARHPEAGGVYAYGRIYLGRPVGVVGGLVFIVGKTASASAAALTIGLYVWPQRTTQVALGAIVIALVMNIRGLVRSTRVAAVMVIFVGIALGAFVISSGLTLATRSVESSPSIPGAEPMGILAAAGLVFVAFAGYARITVLGEEVKNPRRTIPRAIAVSFAMVLFAYVLVAFVVLSADRAGVTIGPAALDDIARALAPSWVVTMVVVGSVLGAGAVLWSLIAGVGRTVFAMASRGDAPRFFAAAGRRSRIPIRAEVPASNLRQSPARW